MAVSRANLIRSAAIVKRGSAVFFTQNDIVTKHLAEWGDVPTSMFSRVDRFKKDLVIKLPLRLWGAWENISTLFPSAILNFTPGASLYGASDTSWVIWARNGQRITYTNGQITKLIDLYLGVDSDIFAADVEVSFIIGNNMNPEDAGAYFTIDSSPFTDASFAKTNYQRLRFTGAWGETAGFTDIVPQKGFNVAWTLNLRPLPVDGLGTVDMIIDDFYGAMKCIPIGPSVTNMSSAGQLNTPHGTLLSTESDDFTLSSSGPVIVLKKAALTQQSYAFGREPLLVNEIMVETTRGLTAGVPDAVATVT